MRGRNYLKANLFRSRLQRKYTRKEVGLRDGRHEVRRTDQGRLRPDARRALVNHPLLGRGEIDPLVFDGLILRGDAEDFQRLVG